METLCLVRITLPGVSRHLRMWTQRARPNGSAGRVAGYELRRWLTGLHPLIDCPEHIDVRGSAAATTVPHSRHHEEPYILLGASLTNLLDQRLVEIDGRLGRNQPVGP